VLRRGLAVGSQHLLTVPGRRTGIPRSTPVSIVLVEGERHIAAAFEDAAWVKNVREAGGRTLARGRRIERVGLAELAVDRRDPILRARLTDAAVGRTVGAWTAATSLQPPPGASHARRSIRAPDRERSPVRAMTDPLALEPILPEPERLALHANERSPSDDARTAAFIAHVHAGGKVEATDWMPDEYRTAVLRFVEMHANSELMGVLPERDWIMRAPTLRRKLALTAKIQDEVGHAQLLYRVAEDLGKPREAMIEDLLAGKTKFHNVFHYPTRTWADIGIIAWLVDAAAIVAQQALRDSSYAPYARTMRKICWEESVHIMHGRDVVVTMADGTAAQRAMVQEALDRWWGPLMQMHGPRSPRDQDRDLFWRIKARTSEELRQEFLSIYVPRLLELGLTIPDPELHHDEAAGAWRYTEPDWAELRSVVTGHGPASQERLGFRRLHWEDQAWVRASILRAAAA
jgi:ring-1,2-phenylacetyl-CoA epoxidase subunit PaaA